MVTKEEKIIFRKLDRILQGIIQPKRQERRDCHSRNGTITAKRRATSALRKAPSQDDVSAEPYMYYTEV